MSVTAVNPYENSDGGVDSEGVRTYTNEYHVYTNDKNDGSLTARGAAAIALGLPAYGDFWQWYNDFDEYAICQTRRAKLADVTGTRKKWIVTCGFTTKLQKRDPSTEQEEPDQEPWKISGSYATGTRAVERDRNGIANTNSAEEPIFDEIPSGNDTIILEGNTRTISLPVRAAAKSKTNSASMWGLQPRQLLLMQWAYDIGYRKTTPYVHHRLEFWVANDDGLNDKWDLVVIDKGMRTIVDRTATDHKKRYAVATAQDIAMTNGIYLDGNGLRYDTATYPGGVPLTFENIPEYDFLSNLTFLPNPLPGPFV